MPGCAGLCRVVPGFRKFTRLYRLTLPRQMGLNVSGLSFFLPDLPTQAGNCPAPTKGAGLFLYRL